MLNLETLKKKTFKYLQKLLKQGVSYGIKMFKEVQKYIYAYLKKSIHTMYQNIKDRYRKEDAVYGKNNNVANSGKIFKFKLETKNVNQDPIDLFPISMTNKVGDIVFSVSSKKKIKLGSLIGAKGEGTVFDLGKQHVAKIFHQDKFTSNKLMKIDQLIKGANSDKSISYPIEFLLNSKREVVGYVMPKAQGIPLQRLFSISEIQKYFPKWRLSHLLYLALSLTQAVKKVHEQNLIIGDLNANNILVENEQHVTIIDTDSFQVNDYPSDVGMVEYTRQIHMDSLENGGYKNLLKSKYDDINALSIVIFQILHTGQLPYNHVNGEESYMDNIKKGFFPYDCAGSTSGSVPNASKKQWQMTPQALKNYFCKVFKEDRVVGIKDLEQALTDALKSMKK